MEGQAAQLCFTRFADMPAMPAASVAGRPCHRADSHSMHQNLRIVTHVFVLQGEPDAVRILGPGHAARV
jgi:hypothetical protein